MSKVKLMIEVDEKYYRNIKEQGSFSTATYQGELLQAIANGTPITEGDLISRKALVKSIEEIEDNYDGYEPNDLGKFMNKVYDIIDNAPSIGGNQNE